MAENAQAEVGPAPAPVIAEGQTTSVAENAQAVQEQPVQQAVQEESPPFWHNPLLWIVAAIWIWILLGSKKRKQEKVKADKERERKQNLRKGDRVLTIGRMHGTVVGFTDTTVTLKPDGKSDYTMTFDRVAIHKVEPRPGEEDESEAPKK